MKVSAISVESILSNKEFIQDCKIKAITSDASIKNLVENPFVNRIGLALAGFKESILEGRIHLMGYSEVNYLNNLEEELGKKRVEEIAKKKIPAIVISSSLEPPSYFFELCNKFNIAVFKSTLPSNLLVSKFLFYLSRQLAEKFSCHGTFMDIFGIGVLIIGPPNIGKSESALELISRGHRLIADDHIILRKDISGLIIAEIPREWASGIMEIKSIGFINVNQIFGICAWEKEKEAKLVIKLEDLSEDKIKIGDLQIEEYEIASGIFLPCFTINVKKGRNLALIIEVAVKVFLLKQLGIDFQKSFEAFHNFLCAGKEDEQK